MKSVAGSIFFLFVMTLTSFCQNTGQYSEASAKQSCFIENKGQWDQNILFMARNSGINVWITREKLVFDFYTIKMIPKPDGFKLRSSKDPVDSPVINGHVVSMKILNKGQIKNTGQKIQTSGTLQQYLNYFTGNDPAHWASNVKLFTSVIIENYIAGVDLKLYFDEGRFRYDLIIQAGINPDLISIKFEGQDSVQMQNLRSLFIKTSIGDISHSGLKTYQKTESGQMPVSSSFSKISSDEIGFEIQQYNPSYPVVIDPIIFSSLIGVTNLEYGLDVEVNNNGNAFIGGITLSSNFPSTNGAYHQFGYGSYDVFITKFNTNGTGLVYSTYVGGSNVDYFYALDIDTSGNCYFTGYTNSTNYPTTSGSYQTTYAAVYHMIMITKLNSSGTALVYSTYLGGWYGNYGMDIAVDAANNAYVCGYAYLGYPTTSGAFQRSTPNSWDAVITKLNSSGSSLIYSTYLGGNSTDYCNAIALDAGNNAYVAGYTSSTNFPVSSGCYQSSLNSGQDAFITKLNSSGSALVYSTYLGGNSSVEQANDIAVNSSGNACVVGNTNATNFPLTSGSNAYQLTNKGGSDGFVTILNSNGTNITYSTYIGGDYQENLTHIAIDEEDNILITGTTQSSNYPTSICAIQTSATAISDVIVSELNPTLSSLLYSTLIGGNGGDYGTGLTVNNDNEVYVTGYTYSSNYPTTTGAFQRNYYGSYDAVLSKLSYVILRMDDEVQNTYCAGSTFTMPVEAGCTFGTTNVFSIQLSNASGSFTSPITIGTLTSRTSGNINCYIPKNTTPGTGYRIRLISSNPSFVTPNNGFNIRINPSPTVQFTINGATQCLSNNYFQFTNTSSIPSGSLSYFWKFGDTTYSTLSSPGHHYLNDTNYNVKLIATSDSGCKDSLSRVITINTSPHTSFTVNDSFQCLAGNQFSFSSSTNISSGTYTILWNFADGDTSTKANPKHTYSFTNNYRVKIVATSDKGCKDSALKTMYILPAPVTGFSINDTGQCLNNNNFIFTNKTTLSKGYFGSFWQFGDGGTSAAVNPTHVYLTAQNYTVKLVATSDSGCFDSAKITISLAPLPVAGFTINSSPQCLNGNLFKFTNTSTTASGTLKYHWDFGNGKSDTLTNPAHAYTSDGTYKVTLISTASAECADTIQKQIDINPSPKSSFTINDSDQCLNENNFTFNNTSSIKSGLLNFFWKLGDGTTSTSGNTSHTYTLDKSYQVRLISTSDQGCKDSVQKNVIVFSSPVADYFVNDTGQCADKNFFSFTNTTNINSGTLKYRWFFGDSKTDTLRNPTHVYAKYGNYNVSLISTSNKNCRDTALKTVSVYPLPLAGFSINNPVQCLKGNNFQFFNNSLIPTGSMTYKWMFGDGFLSTLTDPDHSYLSTGKFSIMLIATSAFGCSDSAVSNATTNIMPNANFSISGICLDDPINFKDESFINKPDSLKSWNWDFGDGSVSSGQNPAHTFLNSGNQGIRLIVESNNGCKDSVLKSIFIRAHISSPELNKVTVSEGNSDIEIEWIPPSGGFIKQFILEKSQDNLSFYTFTQPDKQATHYYDYAVLPDSMHYFYRIKAVDSCNYVSDNSNYGKNILLHTTNSKHIAELTWTPYEQWAAGINHYEVEVFDEKTSSFIYVATVDGDTLRFNDDNTALNQSGYCYRVAAVREGDNVKSYSNSSCVPVSFGCFLPNSFTPNGDGLNDELMAVGTFVLKFNLLIFDRWGNLVFETNDMSRGWNGELNGVKVPDGYYYFQMSARGIRNQKISRKGSILLIR
jgi:gliding motility-associated-like protein